MLKETDDIHESVCVDIESSYWVVEGNNKLSMFVRKLSDGSFAHIQYP